MRLSKRYEEAGGGSGGGPRQRGIPDAYPASDALVSSPLRAREAETESVGIALSVVAARSSCGLFSLAGVEGRGVSID